MGILSTLQRNDNFLSEKLFVVFLKNSIQYFHAEIMYG